MNEINPDLSCTKANKGVSTSATNQLSSSKQSSPLASMCPSVTVCDDRTSCILGELNKIYEERLADIDEQTNGNFELKYLTYKEWVEMLLKLIKDLIDVVQELEYEASSRIDLLEKKLQSEGGQGCNTTEIGNLKNDVANLVELIRRTLEEGKWNLEGLNFSTLKLKDIFGQKIEVTDAPNVQAYQNDSPRGTETNDDETLPGTDEDKVFKACIAELKDCLREKEVQLAEKLKQNECLQSELRFFKNQAGQKEKAVANMRALAFEVADKHDQMIELRNQVNSLEEELKKAHKKVQFKDNVIRELRREIKNSTKIEENRPVCQCTSGVKADSDTERQSFKSVAFNDLECTQRTDYTMDTAVDSEMAKLGHSARAEEERCIRVLKEELDELLKYQHCHHESIEDQKRMLATQHARLKELTHKMLSDLSKSRNKLFYLRTHLLALSDTSGSPELSPKQEDSGYISPEDMATECHLIDTLRYRINNIKTENDCLKEQVRKLNNEVMSKTSSSTCRCKGYENSDKILQEVASALSNICGKEVPYEVSGRALTCEGEVHPICQAMINLEAELNEKNQSICRMEERLSVKECEIKKLQEQLFALEEDCHSKNQQIVDLQIAVEFHVTSVERLQGANQHLEDQLAGFKRMSEDSNYQTLLEAKQKLEVECQNQVTTINNLRQALENVKKSGSPPTGHSPPTVSAPTNINLSNPIWGWWRNSNVHDI
ncbi:unnamed protein product [Hermetia illucens]|uniref:Uncharacterized protein n=1 Tax=Hermetia illucens TaxID=343691 RepID=A0A7R8YNU3_HERIL|nr:unnamed protein product [Hermetia illucens]